MIVEFNIDNSLVSVKNVDTKVLDIIARECTLQHSYFVRDYFTKRPTRKTMDLCYFYFRNGDIRFPRGWFWGVYDTLDRLGFDLRINDSRNIPPLKPINSKVIKDFKFYPYQEEAIDNAVDRNYGIVFHPTGSGKTIVMAGIIDKVGVPGIIMVPTRLLLYQTKEVMEGFFPKLKVGVVGDSEYDLGDITVGTSDSLYLRRGQLEEHFKKQRFIFLDEAHHCRENQKDLNTRYFDVAQSIDAPYKIGFTATPGKEGTIKRKLLEATTGSILHELTDKEARDFGIIVDMEVSIYDVPCPIDKGEYHEQYKENLLSNDKFHNLVVGLARKMSKETPTLIIVDRVDKHLKVLNYMIPEAKMLWGGSSKEEREETIKSFEDDEVPILISTIIKEGVNIKNIGCIIMAGGGKDSDALVQKIGRGLRWKEGKDKLILIDFMFQSGTLRKHSNARIKTYKSKGYKVDLVVKMVELDNGFMEVLNDVTKKAGKNKLVKERF